MKKTSLFLFALVLLIGTSCKNGKKSETSDSKTMEKVETIPVQTAHDNEIAVPLSPKRVVVFDIGALDVMDALGISDRIVAMPKQGIPQYLRKYEEDKDIVNAGGLMDPNFEKVDAARPDLIIIGLRQLKDYKEYAEIAPTYLYDLDYKNYVGSVTENVETLGRIFEVEEDAEKQLETMRQSIKKEKETIEKSDAKAVMVLFNNGKFSAYGQGSRFGYIFDDFGVKPQIEDIEASTHGASISSEYILENNPDILYVVDRNAAITEGQIQKKSIENAMIQRTKAFKNGKVIYLSPETWYIAGGGIQSIQKAIEETGAAY